MKRILFSLALVLGLTVGVVPNASAANLSSCLDIRNIQVTVSGGNKVNFSASAYQVCQEFTPASGSVGVFAYLPIYSLGTIWVR
jgi:hypothetical protein